MFFLNVIIIISNSLPYHWDFILFKIYSCLRYMNVHEE